METETVRISEGSRCPIFKSQYFRSRRRYGTFGRTAVIIMKLFAILLIASCNTVLAEEFYILNGETAESHTLPMKLECHRPFNYIYVGSITLNGTVMNETQTEDATNECDRQSLLQSGKDGPVTTCFLTFGDDFSVNDGAILRTVFQCLMSKPEKAPGGSSWKKNNVRKSLTARPNALGIVMFRCSGKEDFVKLDKLSQEGEVMSEALEKYKNLVTRECYIQAMDNLRKTSMGTLNCKFKFEKEDAIDLEVEYRCEDPPLISYAV